jgi:hypothetical protein
MSRDNYLKSMEIAKEPFEAIIMAFMRIADDYNSMLLKAKYPDIWEELKARYNAPGGYLEGEEIEDD